VSIHGGVSLMDTSPNGSQVCVRSVKGMIAKWLCKVPCHDSPRYCTSAFYHSLTISLLCFRLLAQEGSLVSESLTLTLASICVCVMDDIPPSPAPSIQVPTSGLPDSSFCGEESQSSTLFSGSTNISNSSSSPTSTWLPSRCTQ
jgi:hypothetical protein